MLERSLLIPLLVVVVIGAPIIYHEMNPSDESSITRDEFDMVDHTSVDPRSRISTQKDSLAENNFPLNGVLPPGNPKSRNLSAQSKSVPTQSVPTQLPFQMAGFSKTRDDQSPTQFSISPTNQSSIPNSDLTQQPTSRNLAPLVQDGFSTVGSGFRNDGQADYLKPFPDSNPSTSSVNSTPTSQPAVMGSHSIDYSQMTPDFGRAETYFFPGNEHGPDLTAQPLQHLPISNFDEIFRFDIDKQWVLNRWRRVSTTPVDYTDRLTGMRIPLVTGNQSWDLHGSLTYFFDENQQIQRITFRGWTGNAQKLTQFLTQNFNFQSQPSSLAGFFLAKNWRKLIGGMLMKTPTVIERENYLQQYGIVMEINRPNGNLELSEEFRALIAGSHPQSP